MNNLTARQIEDTINKLVSRTASGKAKWVISEVSEELSTDTEKFQFFIFSRDTDNDAPFVFEIYLKPTKEDSDPVQIAHSASRPDNPLNDLLAKLYSVAKLSLEGIKDLAHELAEDLED